MQSEFDIYNCCICQLFYIWGDRSIATENRTLGFLGGSVLIDLSVRYGLLCLPYCCRPLSGVVSLFVKASLTLYRDSVYGSICSVACLHLSLMVSLLHSLNLLSLVVTPLDVFMSWTARYTGGDITWFSHSSVVVADTLLSYTRASLMGCARSLAVLVWIPLRVGCVRSLSSRSERFQKRSFNYLQQLYYTRTARTWEEATRYIGHRRNWRIRCVIVHPRC